MTGKLLRVRVDGTVSRSYPPHPSARSPVRIIDAPFKNQAPRGFAYGELDLRIEIDGNMPANVTYSLDAPGRRNATAPGD